MEPLYQTHVELTMEEYKRYHNALRGRQLIALVLVAEVLFLLLGLIYQDWITWVILFIAMVLLPLILKYSLNRQLLGEYRSNQFQRGQRSEIFFYPDHLEKRAVSSILQVQYRQIYRIVETKTNFYIMLSRNQGIIIVKANCLPELIGFLTQLKNTVKEQRL